MWPSTNNILLPDFAEAVFLEPSFQFFRIRPREQRFVSFPIHHNHVFRIKVVKEVTGLRAKEDLRVVGYFS